MKARQGRERADTTTEEGASEFSREGRVGVLCGVQDKPSAEVLGDLPRCGGGSWPLLHSLGRHGTGCRAQSFPPVATHETR